MMIKKKLSVDPDYKSCVFDLKNKKGVEKVIRLVFPFLQITPNGIPATV